MKSIYVIGSLRNENIPAVSRSLRQIGLEVFDDWHSAGPEADDYLRDYYRERGLTYSEALNSYAAKHIFEFDKKHLDRCDMALLVYPAGRSAHLELGYCVGLGKPAYVLMDQEPERYDLMLQFATKIFMSREEMNEYFSRPGDGSIKGKLAGYEPGSILYVESNYPLFTEHYGHIYQIK